MISGHNSHLLLGDSRFAFPLPNDNSMFPTRRIHRKTNKSKTLALIEVWCMLLRRRDNALSIDTVPERPWNIKVKSDVDIPPK